MIKSTDDIKILRKFLDTGLIQPECGTVSVKHEIELIAFVFCVYEKSAKQSCVSVILNVHNVCQHFSFSTFPRKIHQLLS